MADESSPSDEAARALSSGHQAHDPEEISCEQGLSTMPVYFDMSKMSARRGPFCPGSVLCHAASRAANPRCMSLNMERSNRSRAVARGTAVYLTPYRIVLNSSSVDFKSCGAPEIIAPGHDVERRKGELFVRH
eukprot:jgi/Tetstr1/429932/TSEL_019795.t1